MRFKVRDIDISAGDLFIVLLNKKDADKLSLIALDRVRIKNKKEIICVVDIYEGWKKVKEGEVGLFEEVLKEIKVRNGEVVSVVPVEKPRVLDYIRKKLEGNSLEREEINEIIKSILKNELTEIERTYFVSGCYVHGLSLDESYYLTMAIVNNSKKLNFGKKIIVDKHCLPEDIPTIVRNSDKVKIEPIGKIIDSIFERCKPSEIISYDEVEFTSNKLRNLKVLAHDDLGKVDFVPVSGVFRVKSPKYLYEITLKGNRSIKATKDHTIFILKNGRIENIPIKEIKEGDFILVPTKVKKRKPIDNINIKKELNANIRNYRKFESKVRITPEFMRLLGYYVAEGFTNYQGVFFNFGSHEKELIEDTIKCVKKVFGFTPTINKPHKTAIRVCLYSQILSKVFKDVIKGGDNALSKKIPYFIFDVEDGMKFEFIRALFKGDGYVRRGYEAIYVTSSKKLATELQYLLSILGLSVSLSKKEGGERKFPNVDKLNKVSESYYIYTQAREIFGGRKKANVGFVNLLPTKELGKIDTKDIGWKFRGCLKRQKYMTKNKLKSIVEKIESEDIRNIINGHLGVLPVKRVNKIPSISKYIYDFKVDGLHRFVAGSAPMCIHNSIGGVAGNRTTMIVVPILVAAGLTVPKTSTRNITSVSGTSDTMEVLARVDFSAKEIKNIVNRIGGCMVWGGALELASADDRLIKIERPLSLDPKGIMLASIMAKKKSVGATHVIIDLPFGEGSKLKSIDEAIKLKSKFIELGKKLGIKVKIMISDGTQPVGNGVGPCLEAIDVLNVLLNKGPEDLKEKSIKMAGDIFEMLGYKNGRKKALEILESGGAYETMKKIIKAQKGKIFRPEQIKLGRFKYDVKTEKNGRVKSLDNRLINKIGMVLGAPRDKEAGIYFNFKKNGKVNKNDLLFTLYSNSEEKLKNSLEILEKRSFIKIK